MRRRDFIAGLLLTVTMHWAQAQPSGRVYRIVIVNPALPVTDLTQANRYYRPLFDELHRLGYIEGQNLTVERLTGEGRREHYTELAGHVASLRPDVIFTEGLMTYRLKAVTSTIPIVGMVSDPVALGLVRSLAHPGGNITGVVTDAGNEIQAKRFELMREVVPSLSKIAFLAPQRALQGPWGAPLREAAQQAGISLFDASLDTHPQEPEYRRVFAAMAREEVNGLIVADVPEVYGYPRLIVELAKQYRLPTLYPAREFVELGGLFAYGVDYDDLFRRAGDIVGRILNGDKPGDIPFYQATTFELVLNLRTAKALGIEMPPLLLARADEVIE